MINYMTCLKNSIGLFKIIEFQMNLAGLDINTYCSEVKGFCVYGNFEN